VSGRPAIGKVRGRPGGHAVRCGRRSRRPGSAVPGGSGRLIRIHHGPEPGPLGKQPELSSLKAKIISLGGRSIRFHIRVLEQPELKFLYQKAPRCLIDPAASRQAV
jgi:hypothetical protein